MYSTVAFIAVANLALGAFYLYSLGFFNEGDSSYTASMKHPLFWIRTCPKPNYSPVPRPNRLTQELIN